MARHEVKFASSKYEFEIIEEIVNRAWGIPWLRKSYENRMGLHMDISAVHSNGNPLRLEDLLNADALNFAHDMSGICNCLDRDTGKLTRNFSPRFSQRAE